MPDPATRDPAIQAVVDESAILKVLQRYCHSVDRCDAELLASCYWDDATDDHGTYSGSAAGFVEFVIPLVRRAYSATTHVLGQSMIALDGDRAAAETYVLACHRLANAASPMLNVIGGRYVDRFERRGGEWRIADRTLLVDWVQNQADGTVPEGARAVTLDLFRNGQRDRSDHASTLMRELAGGGQARVPGR